MKTTPTAPHPADVRTALQALADLLRDYDARIATPEDAAVLFHRAAAVIAQAQYTTQCARCGTTLTGRPREPTDVATVCQSCFDHLQVAGDRHSTRD